MCKAYIFTNLEQRNADRYLTRSSGDWQFRTNIVSRYLAQAQLTSRASRFSSSTARQISTQKPAIVGQS